MDSIIPPPQASVLRLAATLATLRNFPLDWGTQADLILGAVDDGLVGLDVAALIRAAYGAPGRRAARLLRCTGGPIVAATLAEVATGRGLGVPVAVLRKAFARRDPPLKPIWRPRTMARPTTTIRDFLQALRHAVHRRGYDVRPHKGTRATLLLYATGNGALWTVLEVVYDAYYRPPNAPMAAHPGQACGLAAKDARRVRRAAGAWPGHSRKLRRAIWRACGHDLGAIAEEF